jgi:hypothetical protein
MGFHLLKFKGYLALAGDEENKTLSENNSFPTAATNWPCSQWILRTSIILFIANVALFGFSASNFYRTESCEAVLSN